MQVGILGPLEVRDAQGVVEIAGARLRTVLARLAVDAGRPVSPAALVDAVWGDTPPSDAANALQTLMSRLRRTLGDASLIAQSPAGYRLALDPSVVDAHRFETLAADGARQLKNGDPTVAAQLLRDALALWRGPALSDAGAAASGSVATRLEELRLTTLLDRIAADVACGRADAVIAELEALADEHPLDERIAARLVTALAATGRQADALRCYDQVRARLADELGVDPSADLQAAHLAVLRGEVERLPTTPPAPTRRTNLKAQLSSFVGRDEDVRKVVKALGEHRLVTLIGPGGAGKTRLANEAGAELTPHDGVWIAELAPLTDGSDIAQTVLGALGFRESQLLDHRPNREIRDAERRLVDLLAERDTVLVLDNCEHVIDASARVAEHLLGRCPGLRVLATSREPLDIIGEVVIGVPALGQPASDASAEVALGYPAVRLFADRAASVRPDFEVGDGNVAQVIEIVRRLDGLPLAIELAAARLRTMPVDEVAARLSDRFRLLTGGSRTALPRHRTLHAVVEWSWELLDQGERALAERLSVYPAGVTTESAHAVADDLLDAGDDIADLLGSLVDKSLLQSIDDGHRLRMLETIREFGIERLAERGELTDVRARHARYFVDLIDSAQPHLLSREQLPWLALLTDERDNILAAMRFCCDTGAADEALALAAGVSSVAMLLGNHAEIGGWVAEALAVPGWTDANLRWAASAIYAMNAAGTGRDADTVDGAGSQIKTLAEHIDEITADDPFYGVLRIAVAFFSGDYDLTERVLAEALASPRDWARAAAHMFRANLAENNGDVDGMREDIAAALTQFRVIGDRWGLAGTLRSAALLATLDGDLERAEGAYTEALELMREMNSREDQAFLLVRLADVAIRRGDGDRARSLVRAAADAAEASGGQPESVFTLSMLAEIERRDGNLDTARAMHAQALETIESLPAGHAGESHARAMVQAMSARLTLDDGDVAAAVDSIGAAYVAAVSTKDRPILAAVGVVIAQMLDGLGRPGDSAEVLGGAARLRGAEDLTSRDIADLREALVRALGEREFGRRYTTGKQLDHDGAAARLDPVVLFGDVSSRAVG